MKKLNIGLIFVVLILSITVSSYPIANLLVTNNIVYNMYATIAEIKVISKFGGHLGNQYTLIYERLY